ncbi:MAG: hypothetical protein OMM_13802, partial [Candidatus Magnetoglobus multicellularis str. Araruama]
MKKLKQQPIEDLEKLLTYKFKTKKLLKQALRHRSFVKNQTTTKSLLEHNERLEFLGDAVLKLAISHYLFSNFAPFSEGQMSKIRAHVVSDETLALAAQRINLGAFIFLSTNAINNGGRLQESILA